MFDSLSLLLTSLLLLPFLGFVGLVGVGNKASAGWAGAGLSLVGLGLSGYLAATLPPIQRWQTTWITGVAQPISLSFQLDAVGKMMLMLVHTIALLVQVYSIGYLRNDSNRGRYFGFLQLFIGAMLGIILAGNLLILYAFWELVGLASLLLIGFWHERPAAAAAAKKAFLMNRIGDAAFLLGILTTYAQTNSLAFGGAPLTTAAGLCLFMGCVAKSAQFPLLTWLPDAMEGPTPVSALLHAATMVAAGIFLLARILPMLSPDALLVVTSIGTVTALWGGFSALYQTDIKRVLAFSTIAQLGLMVAAIGMNNPGGALFHLLTHASFKAGLFLAAGNVIHAVHTQDMRQMGGLRTALPHTYLTYLVCAAALAGLPLLSGFLSKEAILGGAFAWAGQRGGIAGLVPLLLLASSGLTAVYMTRQLKLIFLGKPATGTPAHEPGWLMRGPVWVLTVLSLGIWFSINPFSLHTSWFFAALDFAAPHAPAWLAPLSAGVAGLGIWLGYRLPEPTETNPLARLSRHYGYLDELYTYLIGIPSLRLASLINRADIRLVDGLVNGLGIATVLLAHLVRFFDRFGVDGLVNGAAKMATAFGQLTRSVQGGRVQTYIATAVGLVLVLLWLIL